MNAEKLNLGPPPPSPPAPTHVDKLVSPFLVTNHLSTKPVKPEKHLINSPFLVDPTTFPFAEEPIMFDLEDILKESEVYPLAPPAPSPTLPTMEEMITELTGFKLPSSNENIGPAFQSLDETLPSSKPR